MGAIQKFLAITKNDTWLFVEKLKRLLDSIVSLEDIFDRARIPILLTYDFSVLIISFSLIFGNSFLGCLLSKDKLFN